MLEGLGDSVAMMHVLALPPRLSYIHNQTHNQPRQFGNGQDGRRTPVSVIYGYCKVCPSMSIGTIMWLLQ
jgi:hypothetical protein